MSTNKSKTDLGYLGMEYQERLLSQIYSDKNFAKNILNVLSPNYFSNEHLKIITQLTINRYQDNDVIVDYGSLKIIINNTYEEGQLRDSLVAYVDKIKSTSKNDWQFIQDSAIKFCKVQELDKITTNIKKEIAKGNIDDVLAFEGQIGEIMAIGKKEHNIISSFDNIDDLLVEAYRDPIPTGIEQLDIDMNGGLARGELGIVIAPLGVGKTTVSSIVANTAYNLDLNVLQLCFEDDPKEIQRKHLARWTGININELAAKRDQVKRIASEMTKGKHGKLIINKMSSIDTTMKIIKNYIKDLRNNGIILDMMIVDYIDCVQPSRQYTDANVAEGMIMREYENLLSEFNIAGWAMTQGNRSSISAAVVNTDQMGGSIKKAQIGHFIMSLARTIEQKKDNKANIAILKSRFGRDGIVYENCEFHNGTLQVKINVQPDGLDTLFQNSANPGFEGSSTETLNRIIQEMGNAGI